jgi:hypothetical protein
MEVLKWGFSAIAALTITFIGIGLAIGAVIFATFFKILGILGFISAGIACLLKEEIDERSKK